MTTSSVHVGSRPNDFLLLIPGFIIVAISAPFTYYFHARLKTGKETQSDEEILRQTELELLAEERKSSAKK